MDKTLLFIVNPRAGKTKSSAPLFDAVATFGKAGYLVKVALTQAPGDAARFAAQWGGDFDLVVCAGGDGTLNGTLSGLMQLENRPPVGYLPNGSTNDFAASLRIPATVPEAARAVVEVLAAGYRLYGQSIAQAMEAGKYPPYKASGMAYIAFAQQEKPLFRLLFMRDRSHEDASPRLGDDVEPLLDLIQQAAGNSRESARMFHLEMWIYVHGIAAMAATSFLDWDTELISASLTDAYRGLLARFKEKEAQE